MTTATDQHVDPLTAMLYPAYTKRCDHCGGYVVTTPEEAVQRYTEAAYEPLAALAKALQDPAAAMTGLPTMGAGAWTEAVPRKRGHHEHGKHHHHHHHHRHRGDDCGCDDCRCRDCKRDDCHCRCCVVNADLVVNARLGERRVVPITIENNRRREREIKLELSEFSTRGGSRTAVTGTLVTPAEFTLAACQEHDAVIVIELQPLKDDDNDDNDDNDDTIDRRRLPDVDDCVVAYADLRIVGCDNRPVRIAVATLPRDCHSYPVDCSCGCC